MRNIFNSIAVATFAISATSFCAGAFAQQQSFVMNPASAPSPNARIQSYQMNPQTKASPNASFGLVQVGVAYVSEVSAGDTPKTMPMPIFKYIRLQQPTAATPPAGNMQQQGQRRTNPGQMGMVQPNSASIVHQQRPHLGPSSQATLSAPKRAAVQGYACIVNGVSLRTRSVADCQAIGRKSWESRTKPAGS